MSSNIRWIGVGKRDNRRIWGYIETPNSPWKNPYITTFWGKKNGNIYFQKVKNGPEFKTNFSRKKQKYTETPALIDFVTEEYEKSVILEKLKGESQ